jgi:hypothetical protein
VASTGEEFKQLFLLLVVIAASIKITGVLVIAQAVSRYTCQAKASYDKAFGASAGGRCVLITTYGQSLLALAFGVGGVLYSVLSRSVQILWSVSSAVRCAITLILTNKEQS